MLSSSVPKFDLGPFEFWFLKKFGHLLLSVIKGHCSHICRVCYKQTSFREFEFCLWEFSVSFQRVNNVWFLMLDQVGGQKLGMLVSFPSLVPPLVLPVLVLHPQDTRGLLLLLELVIFTMSVIRNRSYQTNKVSQNFQNWGFQKGERSCRPSRAGGSNRQTLVSLGSLRGPNCIKDEQGI